MAATSQLVQVIDTSKAAAYDKNVEVCVVSRKSAHCDGNVVVKEARVSLARRMRSLEDMEEK